MAESVKTYDIAIIGGGIAGAGIARDASLRGLQVALFEKNTFGSGTSSKSSKLIHGGIRYLETAWNALCRGYLKEAWKNFHFVFESLKESSILEKTAPDLVKPIPLVVPIVKKTGRGPITIYAGSILYYILALLAGRGRMPEIFWTKKSLLKKIPALNSEELLGGVLIWDHLTDDVRLVQAVVRSAVQAGTEAFEQTEVVGYRYEEGRGLYDVSVRQNGETRHYFSRKLIDASGPWVDKIRTLGGERYGDYLFPVAGSHITFKKFIPYSVILQAEDRRLFFVINIGENSRVGTTERIYEDPDALTTTEEEVDYLLRALKHYFPKISLEKKNILSRDSGIRPLVRPPMTVPAHDISREHEIRVGPSGVIHVLGVKLTDHRRAAEEIVDALIPEFSRIYPNVPRKTLTVDRPLSQI